MSRFLSQALAIPVTENISPIASRFTSRCLYTTPGAYTFTVPAGVCCITAVAVGPGAKQCELLTGIDISIPMESLTRTMCLATSCPMTLCSIDAGGPTTCAHRQCNIISVTANHCQIFQYCGCCLADSTPNVGYVCGAQKGPANIIYRYTYIPNGAGGGYAEKAVATAPGCSFCVIVGSHCGTDVANTPFSCVGGVVCATGFRVCTSDCYMYGFDCFRTPSDFMGSMTTTLGANNSSMFYTQSGSANYRFEKCCFCVIPGCGFGGDINRVGGFNFCCTCAIVSTNCQCLLAYRCYCCVTQGISGSNYYVFGSPHVHQRLQQMSLQVQAGCTADWIASSCACCCQLICTGCMTTGLVPLQMLVCSSSCGYSGVFQVINPSYPATSYGCTMHYAHRNVLYSFCWRHDFTNLGDVCSFASCAPGTFDLTCNNTYFNCLSICDCTNVLECFCCGTGPNPVTTAAPCGKSPFLHASSYLNACPTTIAATPFYKFGGSSAGNYYGNGVSSLSDGPSYILENSGIYQDQGNPNCSACFRCSMCTDNRCMLLNCAYTAAGCYNVCCMWGYTGNGWIPSYNSCGPGQALHGTIQAAGVIWNADGGGCCLWTSYDPVVGCLQFLYPTGYNVNCIFSLDFLNWYVVNSCVSCRAENRGHRYNPCVDGVCSCMCLCINGPSYVSFNTFSANTYLEDVNKFGFETGPFFTCEANSDTLPIVVHQSLKGPIKPRVTRLIDSAVSNFGFKGDTFTVVSEFTVTRCGGPGGVCFTQTLNASGACCYANCCARPITWSRYNYYGTCYNNHQQFYDTTFGVTTTGCHSVTLCLGAPSYTDTTWCYRLCYTGLHCNYPCCIGYNYTTAACKPVNRNPLINIYDYVCTTMMCNRQQTDSATEACLILCNWKGWFDHNKYTLGIANFQNFLSAMYAACSTYNSAYCCIFESINCLQVSDPLYGIGQVHSMCFSYRRCQSYPGCVVGYSSSCHCITYCGNNDAITPPRCLINVLSPITFRNNSLLCNSVCMCCNPSCYSGQGGAGTATTGTWSSSQGTCTLVCTTGGCICCITVSGPGCNMTLPPFVNICCTCGGVDAQLKSYILGNPLMGYYCGPTMGVSAITVSSGFLAGIEIICGGTGFVSAPTLGFCYDCCWTSCRTACYNACFSTCCSNLVGAGCSAGIAVSCATAWATAAVAATCPTTNVLIAPACSIYCCVTAYQSLGSGGGSCTGVNNISKCVDIVDSSIIKTVKPGRGGRGNEVDYEPYYYSYPGISAQLAIPISPCCYVGDSMASGCNWFDTPQIRGSGGNGTFTSAYLACIPAQAPGPGGGGPIGCDGNSCLIGAGGVLAGGSGCCGNGGLGGGAGWCGTPGTGMVVIYWNA